VVGTDSILLVARETPALIDHEFLSNPFSDFLKFLLPLKLHGWKRGFISSAFTIEAD